MTNEKQLEWFYSQIIELQDNLYRFAYSILNSEPHAEDAVNNAIIKAHDNLYQLRSDKKIRAWLFTIVRNECYSIINSQNRFTVMDEDLPDHKTGNIEQQLDINHAMMQLTPVHRAILTLYYGFDYSTKEIAAIMEIPSGTVKSRLSRARNELKKILGDDYYE